MVAGRPYPVLGDLVGGGAGQGVDELDVARDHEPGQPRLAERDQLGRLQVGAGPAHDDQLDVIFPEIRRHADGGGLEHRGVQVDLALQVEGRDVLAPPPDRVLDPVEEVEPAVLVTPQPVAGVEPQVAEAAGRRVRVAVVPGGHHEGLLRAHHQLPRLAGTHLAVPLVDDRHVVALLVGPPTRPRTPLPEGAGRGDADLGAGVGLHRPHPEARPQRLVEDRLAHVEDLQRMVLVAQVGRRAQQDRDHREHAHGDPGVEASHVVPEPRGAEPLDDGDCATRQQRRHHPVPETGGVEQRERTVGRLAPPVHDVERVEGARQRQRVRDQRPLGGPRRAGGVHDRLQVREADVDLGRVRAGRQEAGQRHRRRAQEVQGHPGHAVGAHDDPDQAGDLVGHHRQPVRIAAVDDQRRDVGASQDLAEQPTPVVDIDRHGDGSEASQREDHVEEVRTVGEHDADVVAPADPGAGQPLGHPVGHRVHLTVAELAFPELEEGRSAMGLCSRPEDVAEDEALKRVCA